MDNFIIDLSKTKIDRLNTEAVANKCELELSMIIGKVVESLSTDHFYDMGDFGGDEDLYVLEISHPDENDDEWVITYLFKEIGNLKFDVEKQD